MGGVRQEPPVRWTAIASACLRPAAALERDTEIRQLLEARNARRVRRGEAPVDVEQELRRLTAPLVDAALRRRSASS